MKVVIRSNVTDETSIETTPPFSLLGESAGRERPEMRFKSVGATSAAHTALLMRVSGTFGSQERITPRQSVGIWQQVLSRGYSR